MDFLKQIDVRVPKELDVHIVMDNYATHKTAAIKRWLARRSRYHVHFTPTSASWINQVERWFAELTRKKLQRGVRPSTNQLEADMLEARYVRCQDATASRHFQVIWLLARRHTVSQVSETTAYGAVRETG